jgi:hypothetical protein
VPLSTYALLLYVTHYPLHALFWGIRAGIQNQVPEKIKKFSPSLTPYFTTSYLFSIRYKLYAMRYFFDQTRSFTTL